MDHSSHGHSGHSSYSILNFSVDSTEADFILWKAHSIYGFFVSIILIASAAVLKQKLVAWQRDSLTTQAQTPLQNALVYFAQSFLGFVLMLVVMGLNLWAMFGVVGGLTLGNHIFLSGKTTKLEDGEECC